MLLSSLTLVAGLLIPWIAGFFCLRALQPQETRPGALLIDLSAGLLAGYAAVALLLMLQNTALAQVNWWGPLLVLGLLAAGAALFCFRAGFIARGVSPPNATAWSGAARWAALLLAAGVVIHVSYSLIELLTQPLFPWDAWTVWAYRAKAWFFDGSLTPMLRGADWITAAEPFSYASIATNYPYLPSLMHLWAALSLGSWHEALINTPVLPCAIAIALGLAGCIRRAGGSALVCLGAVYLLFSIPLIGAHTSLGGYADIWMAGFAGTGMMLLLCGMLVRERLLQLLGALLLLAGGMVKVEGVVWILAGLGTYLLVQLSARHILMLFAGSAVLVIIAAVTGLTWFDVPMIGELGYRDGMILVPMRSGIRIGLQDVGGAYLLNAFVLDSWHLLWALVLLASAFVVLRFNGPLRKLTLAFFGVFGATQLMIFGLTSQGAWASDYTAINRLPLHMLPPILFLLGMAIDKLRPALAVALGERQIWRSLVVGLSAGTLLACLSVLVWQLGAQGLTRAEQRVITPGDLNFVIGDGTKTADLVRVEEYQDGIALLSSGPTTLEADSLFLLNYSLVYDEDIVSLDQAPAFFWRRADQLLEVSRMTLNSSGFADLSQSDEWGGQIVEYGFFFVENRGEPAQIGALTLEGEGLANTLRQIPRHWFTYAGWSQTSSNWIPGGAFEQVLRLTPLVLLAALLGALLTWLLAGRTHLLPISLMCLMAGWIVLDARWLLERSWQARLSAGQLLEMSIEERIADGYSGKYYAYLQRLLEEKLGPTPARILIIPDPADELYFGLRSRYQLLPHAALLRPTLPFDDPLSTVDYVLFLGDYSDGDPYARIGEPNPRRWRRLRIDSPAARRWMKLIDESPEGTLFRVDTETPQG